jgi:hypothetical protein
MLVGKSFGKRPFGRPRLRCESNIKIGLREVGWENKNWIELVYCGIQWRAVVVAGGRQLENKVYQFNFI